LNTSDTNNKLDQIMVIHILIQKELQLSDITYRKGPTNEGTYLGDKKLLR
jgi:hypothetical protein